MHGLGRLKLYAHFVCGDGNITCIHFIKLVVCVFSHRCVFDHARDFSIECTSAFKLGVVVWVNSCCSVEIVIILNCDEGILEGTN